MSIEHGVGDFQFLRKFARLLQLWVHGDYEDLQALVAIPFMKLLEMNHLLTGERSVPREEAYSGLGLRFFALVVAKGQSSILAY